ncbi:hypothetical protein ACHAQA_005769 [Verticillium albo-atrum]
MEMVEYEPNTPTQFFVLDKFTGKHIATYEHKNGFMFFHSVNAYDYTDAKTGRVNVHVDLCSYEGDVVPYKEYNLSNVVDPARPYQDGTLTRYELAAVDAAEITKIERVTVAAAIPGMASELPRIAKSASMDPNYRGPPPGPIFGRAPELDKRFQPALDFDTDSCYNVPAIGPNGDLSLGLYPFDWPPQKDCRNEEMLERSNVYSRQRCNSGYCVILYAYYFQKDQATTIDGHRHDWEHIAVWVRQSDNYVTHVAVSQHKGYEIRENQNIQWTSQGDGKPAIVYHKDGPSTHCFRFANGADFGNGGPENHWRQWITGPLIGYFGWDTVEQRDRMFTHDWQAAQLAIKNENFAENIRKARPNGLAFDENRDDDGTNNV